MTALKQPVGIASLLAEIGRDPEVLWVTVRRNDEWKWRRPAVGDSNGPYAVTRDTEAVLLVCTVHTSGEAIVADLTLRDSPETTGQALVTDVVLHERQEYRHVAIVARAVGRDFVQ